VQEALTNALKHAPGAHLCLLVCYEHTSVVVEVVEVVDDGPGDRGGPSQGHGLIGMRERVELFGGPSRWGHSERGRVRRARPAPAGPAPT
jgi:signal transduction histidine kinase